MSLFESETEAAIYRQAARELLALLGGESKIVVGSHESYVVDFAQAARLDAELLNEVFLKLVGEEQVLRLPIP